jgi:NRAMP (natural resistance-associated macrophage protein)-like metal ion transporter
MFGGKKGERLNFLANFYYRYRKIIRAIQIYLILAGPGILVMVADNDAGGITTYADTGLKFGYNLIWFLIILGPIAYFVQEMTVRLGAVTKHGHAEAIFSSFGWFWGWFSFLDLSIVNWLTLITEFIGMTTGLAVFGVPPILTVIIVIIIMVFMILSGRYWTWEKIALVFATINLIYIPLAFVSAPNWGAVLRNGIIPNLPGGFNGTLFFFIMANIGTTIAPWMIFFQQSSVVDKGMKEKDIPFGKLDTFIGAIFTVLVAVFIIVAIHSLLPNVVVNTNNLPDAGQTAQMIIQQHSRLAGTLLAIGLFDAGLLGAICISITSSWAFGEVFGWAHSLNQKVREAPWFYGMYIFALITAGGVVLIPGAPLALITLFVQVIAVTLLPAALVFLILILNNKEIMGKYRNTLLDNIISLATVGMIIALSTLYAISTLFPGLFG